MPLPPKIVVDKIVVTCLAVGQGMGNLVEFYDDQSKLVYLALFDFGTDSKRNKEFPHKKDLIDRLDYIIKQIIKPKMKLRRVSTQTQYLLDFLCVSHQDRDHSNLLPFLKREFAELKASSKDVRINDKKKKQKFEVKMGDALPFELFITYIDRKSENNTWPVSKTSTRDICFAYEDADAPKGSEFKYTISVDGTYYNYKESFTYKIAVCFEYKKNDSKHELSGNQILAIIQDEFQFSKTLIFSDDIIEKFKDKTSWVKFEFNSVFSINPNTVIHFSFDLDGSGSSVCYTENTSMVEKNPFTPERKGVKSFKWNDTLILSLFCKTGKGEFMYDPEILFCNGNEEMYVDACCFGGNKNTFTGPYKTIKDIYSAACQYKDDNVPSGIMEKLSDKFTNIEFVILEGYNSSIPKTPKTPLNVPNASGNVMCIILGDKKQKDQKKVIMFSGDATVHTIYTLTKTQIAKSTTTTTDEFAIFTFDLQLPLYDKLKCELLSVPHHGSYTTMQDAKTKTQSTDNKGNLTYFNDFLGIIKPYFAEISSGHNSSHGHPHKSVVLVTLDNIRSNIPANDHYYYYNENDASVGNFKFNKSTQGLFTNVTNIATQAPLILPGDNKYTDQEFTITLNGLTEHKQRKVYDI